ncbi:Crp/Fnr family transcriptional regulator [Chitinophaga sp. HK235]|uniref:Crp/Fnr family transcriptional regulator n=1 Tax=Chitinophaga sp. HK235 TaxID=2952571 RepID=UPI001BAE0359|nr:Crp/Fnr family transcriptional regulator [Chitinophaga sp. HK235]
MKKTAITFEASILQNAQLDSISKEMLFNAAQTQLVKQGDYILTEGQTCQHIWLVEKGACRAFYDNNNKEINTVFFFEQAFIANMKSLRNNEPSLYHLQAIEATTLLRWRKEELTALYQQSPAIAAYGTAQLEQLAIISEAHADWLKVLNPEERYEYILQHQPQLIQRVSITQLSSYIGISRETLSRIRRRVL